MNKKYVNFILSIGSLTLIVLCFWKNNLIASSIRDSAFIFLTKVFPFLFIIMILNNLLISFNFPYFLSKMFPNPTLYLFVMSALSGSPVNAVIIQSFLEKKIFNAKQASLALCFTTLNNPLFLYNYFQMIFSSTKISIKIFLIIYLSNITLMLFLLPKLSYKKNYTFQYTEPHIRYDLIKAITTSFTNLLNIFAIITFFKLTCDILLTSNTILSSLLKGLIEITQGLNLLATTDFSTIIKELLVIVILSFSGLSIHIQISNILTKYPINYKYFYLSRIFLIFVGIILIIST